MCGIFGYIGPNNVVETTIKGLKKLEYRGYDSSGIAGIHDGKMLYNKQVGKISKMEAEVEQEGLELDIAIAQTRWATHGSPSRENAHPHFNNGQTLALVHNGIIENHSALRDMLLKKGVVFHSETDTEVIVHLISDLYRGDLLKAVMAALPLLKGSYALALIHRDYPDQIIGVSHESPLAVGIGIGEMFLASDLHAFTGSAREVIFLDSGEVAVVKKDGYEIYDSMMSPVSKESRELIGKAEEVTRGKFEHYTLKEIFEQPQALRSALSARCIDEYGTAKFDSLDIEMSELLGVKRIIILACGTSYYAGFIGEYMLEEIARIPTQVEISSEYRYKNPIIPNGTLVIAISQSGETADTLAAFRELKAKGATVIAICNVHDSSIAREADSCLYLRAGIEIGVCSTKAFTSQVAVISLFTLLLARMRHLSRDDGQVFLDQLKKVPDHVDAVLQQADAIQALAKKYAQCENFFYLGRRYMYPGAMEGALKLKEIAYINANGYPAGEMKHGPIALINQDCPTVALTGDQYTYEKILSNLMEVKARQGPVIAIAEEGSEGIEEIADDIIWIPSTRDEFSVIPATVACQLFAYYVALERGTEIDQPRNLAKSVTVE
ncbi:MAG: Glutamine--fructose-6-phosphate aminotransferase [isomerizing] [Chlamydiae bacterium]|nr:Glutamine--fructose-6-phosphate aminotransferase [isomerizing] [Chlamydiota bacterium]